MNMKLKWIGLVVLSCGLLVACDEVETKTDNESDVESVFSDALKEQDKRLNELMPTGVKDGRVSQETYLEVSRLIDELPDYGVRNKSYINEMSFDFNVIKKEDFQTGYNSFLNDYDVFIKGFNANPSTSADFELNEHVTSVVYNTEAYIDEMRMFIKDGDSYYNENATSYLDERQISLEAMINAMDKYELFIE